MQLLHRELYINLTLQTVNFRPFVYESKNNSVKVKTLRINKCDPDQNRDNGENNEKNLSLGNANVGWCDNRLGCSC